MSFENANIAIQQFVDNYGNRGRSYNVIDFVLAASSANTAIRMEPPMFLNAPGKKRVVRMNYFPIQCDVEGDCNAGLCDDGDAIEPAQRDFEITRCTATKKYKLNEPDIRRVDYGRWDFSNTALEMIGAALPAARKLLAEDWMTYLFTLKGVHIDGNATKRISVVNPSNGVVNPIGRIQIGKEYQDGGFMEPYILGDAEVLYWTEMVKSGGINAQGQLINRVDIGNSWYDQGILQNIAGDLSNGGWFISIDPQVFKMVSFIANAGIFRTDLSQITDMDKLYYGSLGEGFILGTLTDPVTGVIWDLYINFTKCDATTGRPAWTFQLKHEWDMFVMPDIACNGVGVNGIMAWRTCPAVVADCPTGDSPSPAVAATSYSWTPGAILPMNIFSSDIGGTQVASSDPVTVTDLAGLAAYMNDAYGATELFTVSGSDIVYDGFQELDGNLNNGDVVIDFS